MPFSYSEYSINVLSQATYFIMGKGEKGMNLKLHLSAVLIS